MATNLTSLKALPETFLMVEFHDSKLDPNGTNKMATKPNVVTTQQSALEDASSKTPSPMYFCVLAGVIAIPILFVLGVALEIWDPKIPSYVMWSFLGFLIVMAIWGRVLDLRNKQKQRSYSRI